MKIAKEKYSFFEVDSTQWTGEIAGGSGMYFTLKQSPETKEGKIFLRFHFVGKDGHLIPARPSVAGSLLQWQLAHKIIGEYLERAIDAGLK